MYFAQLCRSSIPSACHRYALGCIPCLEEDEVDSQLKPPCLNLYQSHAKVSLYCSTLGGEVARLYIFLLPMVNEVVLHGGLGGGPRKKRRGRGGISQQCMKAEAGCCYFLC